APLRRRRRWLRARRTARPGPDPRVRAAQPPPQRVSAFLRDRHSRRPADSRPTPAQGDRPPGERHLALPAPRRRAPGAELRERRVPLAALQPVRLLRGGAQRPLSRPGDGAAYTDAVRALTERGRFGIRLGLARTRALLRALGDPQLALRGALV